MAAASAHFYLGANTPAGFYSLYDQLIAPASAEAIFILKGGPGCGKSSLMRRAAEDISARGEMVEYIHCSGDPDSLDAVFFPRLKTAIVDGTAPHIIEPQYPGVIEQYVCLGNCYNTEALKNLRTEVFTLTAAYKSYYSRAYRILDAACQVLGDLPDSFLSPTAVGRMEKRIHSIAAREFKKTGNAPGTITKRFLGGVTSQGVLCRFDTAETLCDRIYEIVDNHRLASPTLQFLQEAATAVGLDVITCPSPLCPKRLEHLLIPALSLGFVTSTDMVPYEGHSFRRIRLDALIQTEALRKNRAKLRFSKKVSRLLIEEAVSALSQAKFYHDELEALYNPYVDFSAVYETGDKIAKQITQTIS
ncbi:MAG: hypothetical protein PHT34_05310 [Oscillospiraceae bacterium]|nr:hypothetical protein [Oscillospiraceae bacterium]